MSPCCFLLPNPPRPSTRTLRSANPAAFPVVAPVAFSKRLIDFGLILLALPVLLPVLALVATWVRLVSRGPALFRQTRVGRGGATFVIYKFRSMHAGARTGRHTRHVRRMVAAGRPMVKLDLLGDDRLIPGGALLRASGLDELPQLWNVLRGEMSLVGPRPCVPEEMPLFSEQQMKRFTGLPGMTGYWQVHGKNRVTFDEMNEMDRYYVENRSSVLDLAILLRTPTAVAGQLVDLRRSRARAIAGLGRAGKRPGGASGQEA